jgi:hypothetical protein
MVPRHDPHGLVADAETTTEQAEMAFVPASERQSATSRAADTIITLGQRNQQKKKRKRNLVPSGEEDDAEMFDYTAGPNLLDTGDVKEVGPVTKKRNKGKHI